MTRQRDPKTGRFVDPDPNDRPTRPTKVQAQRLYAELDALKAQDLAKKLAKVEKELAEERTKLKAAEGEIGEMKSAMRAGLLQSEEKWKQADATVEHLRKALAEEADKAREYKEQRNALHEMLTKAEESAQGWEHTAGTRQSRIEDLELQVKGWKERTSEAQAHAANLVEGNTRLAREGAEKDALLADARNALKAEQDAGSGGAIVLGALAGICGACLGSLLGWWLRGWLHA